MITAPLIVLGQILGFSFAAGLNLYATICLVGIATRFGWIAALPPAVQGVANPVVFATAAVLYFVEFLVDKIPHVDTIWDLLHTIVRPLAAAMLVAAAMAESSLPVQIAAALLAGITALGAHGLKAGLRLILNIRPKKVVNATISIIEDIFAVAVAIAVLMYPVAALVLVAVALPVALLSGPRLWRAGVLAMRAAAARLRGFFGRAGWRDTDDLPPRLRALVAAPAPGRPKPQVARAALRGMKGVGSYKNGWLVLAEGRLSFVYLTLLRARSLSLARIESPQVHRGLWTDSVDFRCADSKCTLFLLKDGPRADIALAEMNARTS